jgi:superfamily II DNA/RNA helicase
MYKQRNFRHTRNNQRKLPTYDPALFVRKAVDHTDEVYTPAHSFSEFGLIPKLHQNILSRGYSVLTPIQDQAIPALIQGRDVVGIANTGTGKTAAFLIPLVNKVFNNRQEKVLIIAPTRELATQIEEELKSFSQGMGVFSVLCIGGVNIRPQISALYRNPNFVIGTPGRLKDLEQQGKIKFGSYNSVVLDEVDRMLDMGFLPDITYIITKLPSQRHSLFFSATLPSNVQNVMQRLLINPMIIKVQTQPTSVNVDQDIIHLRGRSKIDVLEELISNREFTKVLVFGRTKYGMEKLSRELSRRRFKVAAIHGNKSQGQRQRAINDFKRNYIQVLLATDIASRGLDISDVTHVINYDLPGSYEDYIHRIGRTGRANKKGKALTFVD